MGKRIATTTLVFALLLGACGGGSADEAAVEAAVREDLRAENAKDIDAFLSHWTDKGLEQYDVGTRKQLRDPKSEQAKGFGEEKGRIVRFDDITVDGDNATVVVDATLEGRLLQTVFRLKFDLLKRGDEWLHDGFEFVGSPPPSGGADVVDIQAVEYGFVLSKNTAPTDVAFTFKNIGKEPHELTVFKGPDGVKVAQAKKALENVDGGTLEGLPDGYEADHLSFAEPGDSTHVTFADAIPAGTYVFACYMPQGGLDDNGEPKNPDGKPHIQLGMINVITIE